MPECINVAEDKESAAIPSCFDGVPTDKFHDPAQARYATQLAENSASEAKSSKTYFAASRATERCQSEEAPVVEGRANRCKVRHISRATGDVMATASDFDATRQPQNVTAVYAASAATSSNAVAAAALGDAAPTSSGGDAKSLPRNSTAVVAASLSAPSTASYSSGQVRRLGCCHSGKLHLPSCAMSLSTFPGCPFFFCR